MNMNQKAADRMIVSVGGSESPDRHSNKTDRQQLAIEERHNLCNEHITSSSVLHTRRYTLDPWQYTVY